MAKRVVVTSVKWASSIEKFEPNDRVKLQAFKAFVDKFLKEVVSKPAELPKIDWNFYKSKIGVPGMVESFQKSYESLQVPYPSDQGLIAEAEKYNQLHLKKIDEELARLKNKREALTKKLEELEKMVPLTLMTIEELMMSRPDIAPKNEAFWPDNLIQMREWEAERKV